MGGLTGLVGSTLKTNAIVNGDMRVNQIAAVGAGTGGGTSPRWNNIDNCGALSVGVINGAADEAQIADHPILGAQGYCAQARSTAANGVPPAGDIFAKFQSIEGFNFAGFAGLTCVLQFWVKSPLIGTHSVAATNGVDRSFIREFNVVAANTWEQKSVTFTFNAVGGTWNYTNGLGLRIVWPQYLGANFVGAPNVWLNGLFYGSAVFNAMNANLNVYRITDVQMTQDLLIQPFNREAFDAVLLRCKRYYWQTFRYGIFPTSANGLNTGEFNYTAVSAGAVANNGPSIRYPVAMRTIPTFAFKNPVNANNEGYDRAFGGDCSGTQAFTATEESFTPRMTGNAGSVATDTFCAHVFCDARI